MPTGLGDEYAWYCPTLNDSPNDISGNGNDGTYQGGMATVADTGNGGNRAYEFDGVNAHIDDIAVVNGEFSYGGWVKATDLASSYLHLIGNGGDKTLRIPPGASPGTVQSIVKAYSPDRVAVAGVIQSNTWHHLFTVIRGSSHELWVDGSLVAESALTGTETPTTVNFIGKGFNVADGVGLADDVRLYDRPLDTAEIAHLASSRGVLGSPGGSGPPAVHPLSGFAHPLRTTGVVR